MKITRVYNNNVIAATDGNQEMILTGNGIGFQKKADDLVDEKKINKQYIFEDSQRTQFNQLLNRTPILYFQMAESIANRACTELNIELSNQILISLTDHIWYAVERKKRNISMPSLMLYDVKNLYPEEFKVGMWAVKLIEVNTDVTLGEHEASFIAMHIVNATIKSAKSNTKKILSFISDIQNIIENTFSITFDETSFDYFRLVTHLKFLAQHVFQKTPQTKEDMGMFYDTLLQNHIKMERCIDNITEIVKMNYQYTLSKDEQVYLMIHINKVIH